MVNTWVNSKQFRSGPVAIGRPGKFRVIGMLVRYQAQATVFLLVTGNWRICDRLSTTPVRDRSPEPQAASSCRSASRRAFSELLIGLAR